MTNRISVLYITCSDQKEAREISNILIEKKLIGCANIIDGALSIYPWEGKIEESRETILIVKTIKSKVATINETIKQIHSYKIPCVIELEHLTTNPEYRQWIESSLLPALQQEESESDRPPWD